MDAIASMIYETSFRASVNGTVERYVKCRCKCWLDKQNDRFVVSIIDPHDRIWNYEEFNLSDKLYNGISSQTIAHNAVRAYEKKIFREYFK